MEVQKEPSKKPNTGPNILTPIVIPDVKSKHIN